MDKRYQVFVSSTFTDLQEERQNVIQALMEMDCIPAGMELFPAADEEQWEFIKKVINDCDYYLLIIGGRYGSLADDGISYTEKEFDYAVAQGIKIVALIHEEPNNLAFCKSETDPAKIEKLTKFKEKVQTGRIVKFWKTTTELPGIVSLSLNKTMKMYPAVGWVRANQVASNELLAEINQLRKENLALNNALSENTSTTIYNPADLNELYKIQCGYYHPDDPEENVQNFEVEMSWLRIFLLVSPYVLNIPKSADIERKLSRVLYNIDLNGRDDYGYVPFIYEDSFLAITIQLKALGLISIHLVENSFSIWTLTNEGEHLMMDHRVIKKK